MGSIGLCACYFCEGNAVWQIWLAGEDEPAEEAFACEHHARGHVRRAIVLPADFDALPIPTSGEVDEEAATVRDLHPPI